MKIDTQAPLEYGDLDLQRTLSPEQTRMIAESIKRKRQQRSASPLRVASAQILLQAVAPKSFR